jgi:GTPase SAR1 family protein
MVYDYSELVEYSQAWAQQVLDDHWLDAEQLASLLSLDNCTLTLQSSTDQRPLIVAFMGGTGVGKSTLLNRLATEKIAKTGVERPTSDQVTLYHHHSLSFDKLPDQLPIDKTTLAQHNHLQHQSIVWIDMPDMDSTELANKALVLQWLAHIDLLIYVVSPDRYRDRETWQLLLAEGQKYGWLFVFNQWDLGTVEQYDDFKRQLIQVGFKAPIIFRSCCTESIEDEFSQLLTTIQSLATEQNIEQLAQHGLQVKKQQLKQQLQQCLTLLGGDQALDNLIDQWAQRWQQAQITLKKAFAWSMHSYAAQYAKKETLLSAKFVIELWDQWAQNCFDDVLDELILEADQLQLATIPLRKGLQSIRQNVSKLINQQVELSARQAVVNPGNLLHRTLLRLSRVGEIGLPLMTMGIISYQLWLGFYQSTQDQQAYLGVDFAIHSLLLVSMSWLLPYFIGKKMQPSIEKAALKGLNKGLEITFITIDEEIKRVLASIQQQQLQFIQQLTTIIEQCRSCNPDNVEHNSHLARTLLDSTS